MSCSGSPSSSLAGWASSAAASSRFDEVEPSTSSQRRTDSSAGVMPHHAPHNDQMTMSFTPGYRRSRLAANVQ